MMDKISTLHDAVESLEDGSFTLAFGGITLYRRPMGFALALLHKFQQAGTPSELSLLCFTAGLESDILVGAGMVSTVRTCYFGLEAFGLAPQYTAAVGAGEVQVIEESEASIANGLRAEMAGIGFMPSTAWQGTDMLSLRSDVQSIRDPYSGEVLTAFPAIQADVAVIHALQADRSGNASIGLHKGVDQELSLVAEKVILTTEKIVDDIDQADIVGVSVDSIVELPHGAWPTSCHPLYPFDAENILEYSASQDQEDLQALLDTWQEHHGLDRQ